MSNRRKVISGFGILAAAVVLAGAALLVRSRAATGDANAIQIHVAVASNFADAVHEIARRFEARTTHRVVLSFGSTGKHYAQISSGAPFDVFLAADAVRPKLLEDQGVAVTGSRFTYAVGRLVVWSPKKAFVDPRGEVLRNGEFEHLAIANPQLAPYGMAAQEVLEKLGLWDSLQPRLVRGENIAQVYQFVRSGSAELGFVAYAQVKRPGGGSTGSYWEIPHSLYAPLEQQAVLLKDSPAARSFLEFVRGEEALAIILEHGYGAP